MIKDRFKQIVVPVLVAVGVLGVVVLLAAAAGVTSASSRGAPIAAAFHELPEVPPDADRLTVWLPDQWHGTRQLDVPTRRALEAAYIRAWAAMNSFATTGDQDSVDAWFTGPARTAVLAVPRSDASPVWSLGHRLELRFLSNDGTVVGFRDHGTVFVREIAGPHGNMIVETDERFDVVLTLENSYWRVRHLRRLAGSTDHTVVEDSSTFTVAPVPPSSTRVAVPLHGINYEPRATPFEAQWPAFDPRVVAADFDTIRELGLDSVRVFLPYFDLGAERPKAAELDKVQQLLDLAHERDLRVVLTLFDGRTDHRPTQWPSDDAHLRVVIRRFAGHPALEMWDLKNEPDLDDGLYASRLQVRAWLAHVAGVVRQLDTRTPLTIGWAQAGSASDPGMAQLVDVVSFHWYLPAAQLPAAIRRVRAGAGGRPLMIGEFGVPTWNSFLPGGHTEREQAAYYADVLGIAATEGVSSTLAWTLHDLDAAPAAARWPWQSGPQRHLGVLRSDGSRKPAALVLRPSARLDQVPRPGAFERVHKRFWQAVAAGLVVLALLWGSGRWLVRRRRRAQGGEASAEPDGS